MPDSASRKLQERRMLDGFGRKHVYLRISVTDRCNLRCRYCMPPEGIPDIGHHSLLTFEEIERLTALFARYGIKKVRITGGEPTVRKGIVDLAQRIAGIPGVETLALTTNGLLLRELARPLYKAGVRLLNISLDSLRRERYTAITGRDSLPRGLEGIEEALEAGFKQVKINVVVMAGINCDELHDFAAMARNPRLNIRFIEYMPFRGNGWSAAKYMPYPKMLAKLEERYRLKPFHTSATKAGVAKDFRISGFGGTVSFISPLSDEFCARCNRLRITADGGLKTCLFAPPELNLRDLLRQGVTDENLAGLIQSCLLRKPEAHPPAEILKHAACQPMAAIGG